jgi:NAD(P)-dependent dehydrogenase (short-subunit alcohol dehydrogenase family)
MSTGDSPTPRDRRVCLLTGAGGRLGSAFCAAHQGDYDIVAVHGARRPGVPDQHSRYVDPLDPGGPLAANEHPVHSIAADLTADGEIARVVELALARFGRVDMLVNAAVHSTWAPIVDSGALLASVSRQLETNVAVPLRLSVELAAACWRGRRGQPRGEPQRRQRLEPRGHPRLPRPRAERVRRHEGRAQHAHPPHGPGVRGVRGARQRARARQLSVARGN